MSRNHSLARTMLLLAIMAYIVMLSTSSSTAPARASQATSTSTSLPSSGVGINVSPTHFTPVIAVGDETHEKIKLHNSSEKDLLVRGHVEYGSPADARSPVISLEPEQVQMKPGEDAIIDLIIMVPAEASAGQRRDSARFDVSPVSGGNVAIVGQVAVLIDTGMIRPVSDVEWSAPHLIDPTSSASFTVSGRNSGNFPTRLEADIDISYLSGHSTALTASSGDTAIGKTAEMQVIWDDPPLLGVGKATLRLSSGVGSPVEKTAYFIIFPWKIGLPLILLGGAVIFVLIRTRIIAKVFPAKWRKEGNGGRS